MGKRRRARELAIQVLFHLEFNPGDPEEAFRLICESFDAPSAARPFAEALIRGVCEKTSRLDGLIKASSKNWRLERMACADRNILRIGTYEMLYVVDIPPKVSIDEAVELAKRYGTEDSASFVNGVLDDIYNQMKLEGAILKEGAGLAGS